MDRITSSYLEEFVAKYNIEGDESVQFEHFSNFSLLDRYSNDKFDFLAANISANGTLGIDGFAIFINGIFIEDEEMLKDIITHHNDMTANVVFVQSKRSMSIQLPDVGNFGWAVKDFVSEKQQINWSEDAKEKIALFNFMVSKISKFREKPKLTLYFVTLANLQNDPNRDAKVSNIIEDLTAQNLFRDISLEVLGAEQIQTRYKNIGKVFEKTFDFTNRITLPIIEDIKESYLGYITAEQLVELITNDTGELVPELFYDNIRDFQGANPVNMEIAETLKSNESPRFVVMNNGISVIAENLSTSRNSFTIKGYQIINGCQTSHVIFENRAIISNQVMVPIRLVITNSAEVMSKIIRATNRQTEVKVQDLIAFTVFQKRLEDYYAAFDPANRLYYERRSKQYNRTNVSDSRIVDKTTQIKVIASFYYNQPHKVTRYFGALFNEFGDKLFRDDHKFSPYYLAAFALYRINEQLKNHSLDVKFKKAKHFVLMMIKFELGENTHPFSSKDMEKYCENAIKILSDDSSFAKLLSSVVSKMDGLNTDWVNTDISKSSELTDECIKLYRNIPRTKKEATAVLPAV